MTVTRNIWHQKVALLINLPLGVIRLLHPWIRWTKASPSLNPTERGKNIEVLISDTASSYMWLIQRWSFSCLGWNKYEICHTYFVVLLWNRFCFLCPKSFPFAVVFSLHTAHGHILITSLTVECWNTFFFFFFLWHFHKTEMNNIGLDWACVPPLPWRTCRRFLRLSQAALSLLSLGERAGCQLSLSLSQSIHLHAQ